MKKFLSLVLALVMTMSLVTVSAGAKDFSDNSKITYKEAVDVMSAVGVIDGYPDGSFNPTATLTRGAAAKIICNLILGPTTANALVADAAPYKDVPTSNTFAGYIAYCQKEGIISGYADGTFKPANTLTGYAFMKMLLGALGYDASREGYTGANWSIAVGKRALNAGLADNLVGDFNGVKAVTREEACLYAFNMLQADMVEYEKNSTITVGNVTVTDNSAAKSKRWSSSSVNDGNIDSKGGDGYVQFAEEYFNKLVKESDIADDFGRPATKWTYKGVKVGTYSKTADVTYTENVKLGTIYADLKMSDKDEKAVVYVDGVKAVDFANVKKGNDLKLADVKFANPSTGCKVGNGTLTEVYLDRDANKVTIVCINTYVAEVNKAIAATKSKDAYITLTAITGSARTSDEFEATGFESDDVVLYTYAAGDIQSVEKAESISGALNKIVDGKEITIGDKEYKYSKNYNNKDALNIDSEYDVFMDKYGYAIYTRETEYTIADYAFLRQLQSSSTVFGTDKAALLTVDGKYKSVDTKKDYTTGISGYTASEVQIGASGAKIVIAKETSNKDYRLSGVTTTNFNAANDKFVMKSGVAKIDLGNGNSVLANSKTAFVVVKTDGSGRVLSKTAYTGISNAPTIKAMTSSVTTGVDISYYCRNTGIATVMFIKVDTTKYEVTAGSQDIIFFSPESASKKTEDKDDIYYSYNAVVAGKITEVKVAADVNIDNTASNGKFGYAAPNNTTLVYTGATYSDGVITDLSTIKPATDFGTTTGTKKLDGDYNIKLGNKTFVVANDVKVFFLDDDGVITEGNIKNVRNSDTDIATYTLKDGQVNNLFIQQYFENNTSTGANNTKFTATAAVSGSNLTIAVSGGAGSEAYKVEKVIVTNLNNGVSTTIDGTQTGNLTSGSLAAMNVAGITVTGNGLTTYQVVLTVGGETVTSNKVMA